MLSENIFTRLRNSIGARQSVGWFRRQVSKLSNVTPARLLADSTSKVTRVEQFGMYMFYYDPKSKQKLPYYDTFPLTLIIEKKVDGFLGVNFHYLPPNLRLLFLQSLQRGEKPTYNALKQNKYIRPTIKRYLNTHVKSNFIKVGDEDKEMTIFLPVERFKKISKEQVWRESRGMI